MTLELTSGLEIGYERNTLLAVQVLDAVTLARVCDGIALKAEGLGASPIVNSSGYFVWLKEENAVVQKITVEPGNVCIIQEIPTGTRAVETAENIH